MQNGPTYDNFHLICSKNSSKFVDTIILIIKILDDKIVVFQQFRHCWRHSFRMALPGNQYYAD